MRRLFTVVLLYFLAFLPFQAHSQQSRANYQLLWKISGNGLQQPSYLFGTMHLKDKRVFDFSDSVLVKLDECPAFAMEILPDSIVKALFTRFLSPDTTDNLRKALTPEEYDRLNQRLQDEAGITIDKLKSKNPWLINTLLDKTVAVPRKGDKTTFLDAYLYRLARQSDKTLIGLEKIEEQASIVEDYSSLKEGIKTIRTRLDKNHQAKFLENMIELYRTGDIEKLYATVYQSGMNENFRHKLLTERNINMADRLTKYMQKQATFTAVGAAHLPGKDGLIALLQQKGFTVSPVKATFTGMAARYKEKVVTEKWHTFTSKESAYTVDMPSEPFLYDAGGEKAKGIALYMLPDLASGLIYYTSSFMVPVKLETAQQDAFFKGMIEGMAKNKNAKLLRETNITFDNYPGREVELYDGKERMYIRCRVYLRKSNVYMLMVGSTKEQLNGKEAVRFFNSFRFQDFTKPDWKEFADATGAFSIKTPVTLHKERQEVAIENYEGVKMFQNMFAGTDQQKGIAYLAIYSDFSPGFVILQDSTYLSSLPVLVEESAKGKLLENRDITLDQYPGKAFSVKAEGVFYYCRAYLRGNRLYYLIVTAATDEENVKADVEAFFNSFALTDFGKTTFREYISPSGKFTVKVPGEVVVEGDSAQVYYSQLTAQNYTSQDANSGLSYFVVENQYSDYYESKDEETYFKDLITALVKETDTLLRETKLTIDGTMAREIVVQTRGNHTVKRTRFLLKGSQLYELMVYVPEESADSPVINTFFDSFRLSKGLAKGNLFTRKLDKLLADIAASDTLLRKKALEVLDQYTFIEQDLPAVYQSINRNYPDDTVQYGGTKQILINQLATAHNAGTIDFIGKLYNQLPDNRPQHQLACLRVLTHINSTESLTLFTDLILNKTPQVNHYQNVFYSLMDSLAPSKVMYPRIMALASNPDYASALLRLTNQLCDSSVIKPQDIAAFQVQLRTEGQNRFAKHGEATPNKDVDYYSNSYYLQELARLLGRFPEDAANQALLTQLMTSPDDELALAAGMALLPHNKPVNQKTLARTAANRTLRLQLYDQLASLKRLDLFPAKYLTQTYFAESSLVSYLVNDEEGGEPDKIVLLEARETELQGKRGRIYLYKFMYEPEKGEKERWYVGISGLQPLDKKQVSSSTDYTFTSWALLADKTLEEHFRELTGVFSEEE